MVTTSVDPIKKHGASRAIRQKTSGLHKTQESNPKKEFGASWRSSCPKTKMGNIGIFLNSSISHSSFFQCLVDRARIELATHGFSGRCSTD